MSNPFIRWWVVFCSSIFLIILATMFGGIDFLNEHDVTGLSWITLSVFLVGSVHLGYFVRNNTDKIEDYEVTRFFSQTCTSLGMLGTIVGLMISMIGTFDGINASDPESLKSAIVLISGGLGAALTTTLVGLVCYQSLETQLIAIRGKWRA